MSFCSCLTYLALLPLTFYFLKFLYGKWRESKLNETLERWSNTPKDVVILHQFPRGKTIPSLSPFVLKVETFLRMAGIKYQNDFKSKFSPKGKSPWISINGEHIADSEFILEFLSKKFGKNLRQNQDQKSLAIATMCQLMLDEHFYWGLLMERYVFGGLDKLEKFMKISIPRPLHFLAKVIARRMMMSRAKSQGTGLHTEEEIIHLMKKDLRVLSTLLGNQKFICGDEPTQDDCAIFGTLAQIIWTFPNSSYDRLIKTELKNLEDYCYRMKDKYWSDWDQALKE